MKQIKYLLCAAVLLHGAGCQKHDLEDSTTLDRIVDQGGVDQAEFWSLRKTNTFGTRAAQDFLSLLGKTNRVAAADPGKAQILWRLKLRSGSNTVAAIDLCDGEIWQFRQYSFTLKKQIPYWTSSSDDKANNL